MTPPSQQQNLGEVARRLDDVFNRYEQIANDLPKTFVSKDLFEAYKDLAKAQADALKVQMDVQEKRIHELEDDKKWLYRLIVGAVILAVIGLVFATTHQGSTASPTKTSSAAVTQ